MSFPVNNIRDACKARGTSLAQLEKALGIGNGVIARWERAKRSPPIDVIADIANYLNVPVERLTGQKEKPLAQGERLSESELIFNSLSPELQAEALRYMRYLAEQEGN